MTDDPTRAMGLGPSYGRVGPADPHADPATEPRMRPVEPPVPDGPTVPTQAGWAAPPEPPEPVERSRTGILWTGTILSALVLLLLLIFILQNNEPVQITFIGVSGTLPTGVALLFAAVAGLLLVAIPGGLRILQLRRAARRGRR
jgi:uncharacterized integral membrane protein